MKELPAPATPAAANDYYDASAATTLVVAAPGVLANDTNSDPGDTLRAALVTAPSHGTLTLATDGRFSYTPAAATYVGPDSFTYRASDGANSSPPVTVTINVAPRARDDRYYTNEDTLLTVSAPGVLTNDYDLNGDTLTAVARTGPTHGTLNLQSDGAFTYIPAADYHGLDRFTYKTSDGAANSNPITVHLTVRSVNDRPVANAGADRTVNNRERFILAGSGTDVDGDPLTYRWTQVSGPKAVIRYPSRARTSVEGVLGAAALTFQLTASDPTHTDTTTIKVNPK